MRLLGNYGNKKHPQSFRKEVSFKEGAKIHW